MKFYRIEKDGVGPFQFGNSFPNHPISKKLNKLTKKFLHELDSSDFPSPVAFSKLWNKLSAGWVCATDSLESLNLWFSKIMDILINEFEFHIYEIQVQDEYILFGENQVLINPEKIITKRKIK